MKKNYDGWVPKCITPASGGEPFLLASDFAQTRSELIKKWDDLMGDGDWQRARRDGDFKLIKVKLVEVT